MEEGGLVLGERKDWGRDWEGLREDKLQSECTI